MVLPRNSSDGSTARDYRNECTRYRRANKSESERVQQKLEGAGHKRSLLAQRQLRNVQLQVKSIDETAMRENHL